MRSYQRAFSLLETWGHVRPFGILRQAQRNTKNDAGFSLIELLCALVMFAVVSLGVASSTLSAIQTNRASERKGVAVNLAHQVVECVKSQIQAGRTISVANAGQDCNPAALPATYALSGIAVTPNPSGFSGLTRVQITISWRSPLPDNVALDWLVDT